MRTVDQVVAEMKKADEVVKNAQKQADALRAELNEIYQAAMRGLGIGAASGSIGHSIVTQI